MDRVGFITGISTHGIWVLIGEMEYHIPFSDYPALADAKISEIHQVDLLHGHHLRWDSLDVDIDLMALLSPECYPLVFH